MSTFSISIKPFGEHAILVEWPSKVDEKILEDIIQFNQYLKQNCLKKNGWETVPAYNSLTLIQKDDPIEFNNFKEQLKDWYSEENIVDSVERYIWKLPVCYDLNFGIDLETISKELNKSTDEIIALHAQHIYTVFGIGFLPGFMYLGGLPQELEIPRRISPRLKVEKGAVGIAGKQTGVYPQESPGGWNIIGNCPVPIFNSNKKDPCLVNVGDKIQFYPIPRAEYDLHKIQGEVGIYELEKEIINA
ncbi:KipI family sensor histidine kinase inhibitor [Saonia flava]|uniref:KipI family sensor histidine kinase inhibitor n=1 Tax=Saonia flava TaxID=523696 RepID=A0A846QSZ3_9FLAO|nr:5-oxoprolinase subunit PxpB [Saonia flava]NJB70080.1 KipI family sensor histidine kinase inhibitor [Saonia flava]